MEGKLSEEPSSSDDEVCLQNASDEDDDPAFSSGSMPKLQFRSIIHYYLYYFCNVKLWISVIYYWIFFSNSFLAGTWNPKPFGMMRWEWQKSLKSVAKCG